MNKQILLLTLVGFVGTSVKAAEQNYYPGIPGDVQQFALALVAQRDAADVRAEDAEKLVAQLRPQAEEALARAAQFEADAKLLRKKEDTLLADSDEKEAELRQATEDAEQLRRDNRRLLRERNEATAQVDDFLQRLQLLTDQYEAVTRAHGNAKRELKEIALEKKRSDDEVQRLRGEVGSLSDIDFRLQGASISRPRTTSQFSVMAVFNPQQFQRDQEAEKTKKRLRRVQLQEQLQEALGAQKQMQDSVEEAFALVQEKDQEIKVLSVQAVRLQEERVVLEKQKVELENFKDAADEDYRYVMEADVAQATADAAAAVPQGEMPRMVSRGVIQSLLEKLRRIARAAMDEATS